MRVFTRKDENGKRQRVRYSWAHEVAKYVPIIATNHKPHQGAKEKVKRLVRSQNQHA